MAQALGDQEPEHPCILLWDWCGLQKRALEHSDGPAEWGPMHDLRGQVWGCPTHVAHPEPPGPCPTAPPSIASAGEIPIITAVAGGQLLLECPGGAEPHPNIEWHREGSPLQVPVTGPVTVTVRDWDAPAPSGWCWG